VTSEVLVDGAPASPLLAPRQPVLQQLVLPPLAGLALLLLALPGPVSLLIATAVLQLALVLGLLALVEAPAAEGLFLLAIGASVLGDILVLRTDGDAGPLAGVGAAAVVGALLLQLLRRRRERVTESLADSLLVLVVALSAGCLVALRDRPGGEEVLTAALAAGIACLLAARIGDLVLARPELAVGSTRGWPGLVFGLGCGVAAATAVAHQQSGLASDRAALLGLAVAAAVAVADLAVDLGASELRATRRDARRASAVGPVAVLLPWVALAPVALLVGRAILP
jgi:hypothetical protein